MTGKPITIDPSIFHRYGWRTGRKVGRTIYVQFGELPSDDDVLIGVMDTPRLANEAVQAHNAVLRSVQGSSSQAEPLVGGAVKEEQS